MLFFTRTYAAILSLWTNYSNSGCHVLLAKTVADCNEISSKVSKDKYLHSFTCDNVPAWRIKNGYRSIEKNAHAIPHSIMPINHLVGT